MYKLNNNGIAMLAECLSEVLTQHAKNRGCDGEKPFAIYCEELEQDALRKGGWGETIVPAAITITGADEHVIVPHGGFDCEVPRDE